MVVCYSRQYMYTVVTPALSCWGSHPFPFLSSSLLPPHTPPLPSISLFSASYSVCVRISCYVFVHTFAGISFQSCNVFYYLWCECVCMVSRCCVWCPCVVTAVLSSLFLFWSYFTRVVFHTSWHMMHTTWPTHNIIIYPPVWPFFPLLLIYFNDLQLPTITYQHRIAQYLHT